MQRRNAAPRHITTPDDSRVDPALGAWVARVPREGYGGISKSSVLWMPKVERLRAPYVRVQNSDRFGMIVVDADHSRSDPAYPLDVGLPAPNLAVGSYTLQPALPDATGGPPLWHAGDGGWWREGEVAAARCHYVYLLKEPVTRPRAGRKAPARHWKPLWYYMQVAAGLNAAVSGDWCFPGYLSKNPLRCDRWHVVAFDSEPFELDELAEAVDLGVAGPAAWIAETPVPGGTIPEIALALHDRLEADDCSDDGLFVVLREAAKQGIDNIVANAKTWRGAEVEFCDQVREAGSQLQLLTGLDETHVATVAQSVADYIWRHHDPEIAGFTSARGINRGTMGLTGRPDLSLQHRQRMGGQYAARQREKTTRTNVRQAEERLHAHGFPATATAVAREAGVARQTARKHMTTARQPGRPRSA